MRQYLPDGTEGWTRQFGTIDYDFVVDVAIDESGNVYVAGFTAGAFTGQASAGKYDIFVRKYIADGTEGWTRQFGTDTGDWATGIAVDGTGRVYVAGYTFGSLSGSPSDGQYQAFVRRYSVDGEEGWTELFDFVGGLAADASGNVYVIWVAMETTDEQGSAGEARAFARLYGPEGSEHSTFEFSAAGVGEITGVAVDPRGNVYVSGREGVMKLRPTDTATTNPTTPIPPFTQTSDRTYYPETGHGLSYGFKAFWELNGGLPVFGYPLTEEFTEHDHTVQYLERQRFEWHPENTGTPYAVLLGRLGAELLAWQGRDWHNFPTGDPSSEHYMDVTKHAIAPEFWAYWSGHGLDFGDPGISFRESLALFGYPLSEPMTETNADGDTVLTQYFERAVFEWHPDNDDRFKVLLRRLGAEELQARGWLPGRLSADRIAFDAGVDGSWDIYLMHGDGSQLMNLTNHPAADVAPRWSPDGRLLLFLSDRDGAPGIYVMNADGADLRAVYLGAGAGEGLYGAVWSPDGQQIAFAMSGDIFIVGLDGTDLRNLTNSPASDWDPSWSPDGRQIAYVSELPPTADSTRSREIVHVINVDSANDTPVTLDLYIARHPTWSPDGTRIAFEHGTNPGSGIPYSDSIYLMNPDGSDKTRLTTCYEGTFCFGWNWSPDSTNVAVARDPTRYPDGDSELVVVMADGSGEQIVANGDFIAWPSWSPDGSNVAFVRLVSEELAIYRINTDGGDLQKLTSGTVDYGTPVWAPGPSADTYATVGHDIQ